MDLFWFPVSLNTRAGGIRLDFLVYHADNGGQMMRNDKKRRNRAESVRENRCQESEEDQQMRRSGARLENWIENRSNGKRGGGVSLMH